jgi:3-deoxy-D-manno-octulosonate 8-phosphate phosphatase KdsC-like HAD superfamily phosphatase
MSLMQQWQDLTENQTEATIKSFWKEYCEAENISLSRVLYIGNDLNDYEAMKLVGIVGAPADAEEEILEIADWISTKKGGYGVIRELARLLTQTV